MQILGDLHEKRCAPLKDGAKPLIPEEYEAYLRQVLSGWGAVEQKAIEKEYKFVNFQEAMDFVSKVGQIAEAENHHPDIFLHDWNKVRLTFSTHAVGGLSENDFILAAKIDA